MKDEDSTMNVPTPEVTTPEFAEEPAPIADAADDASTTETTPKVDAVNTPEKGADDTSSTPKGDAVTTEGGDDKALDPAIVARMNDYGFSEAEVKSFGTVEAAQAVLAGMDRRVAAMATAPTVPAPEAALPPAVEKTVEPYKSGLDPDEYDENVIKEIETLGNQMQQQASQMQAMQAENDRLLAERQQSSQDSRISRFDESIAKLPDVYKETFGTGESGALLRSSPAYSNREQVFQYMNAIEVGLKSIGQTPPSQDELFERALGALYSDKQQAIAQQELSARISATSQTIARPTHRGSLAALDDSGSEQKAVQSVKAKLAEFEAAG